MNSNNTLETLPTNSSAVSQISQPNEDKVETITSLQLVNQINFFRLKERINDPENRLLANTNHGDLLKIIRDEFGEEIAVGELTLTHYDQDNGAMTPTRRPMFVLTLSQAKQVLVRESKLVRKAVIKYIEELENKFSTSISIKDQLQLQLFSSDRMEVVNAHKALIELETRPLLARIEEDKPTQEVIKVGYFKVDERSYINPATFRPVTYFVTKITGKGQIWLAKKFKDWSYGD